MGNHTMADDKEDDGFAVFWESGDRNVMTSSELKTMPFDTASWAAFLSMLMKRRRFAVMTMHAEGIKLAVKVIPIVECARDTSFASLC